MWYSSCLEGRDKFLESAQSFYHVDSECQTQVFRLGGNHLYPLSQLACQGVMSQIVLISESPAFISRTLAGLKLCVLTSA